MAWYRYDESITIGESFLFPSTRRGVISGTPSVASARTPLSLKEQDFEERLPILGNVEAVKVAGHG